MPTPVSWILIVILITLGGFEFLLSFVSVLMLVLYVAVMAGVIRLRITEPETPRLYKSLGYPTVALVLTISWAAIAIFVAVIQPKSALYALAMVASSVPVFLWMESRR